MSKKVIPEQTIIICDGCNAQCDENSRSNNGSRFLKGTIVIENELMDFMGDRAGRYHGQFDLCDSCLAKVKSAIGDILPILK